ncbi:MAG: holo-ACP synthase [Chloroflexi bacterium]|nr:holo-ACP synthase [Chloroflexota bacterium]
MIKANKLGIGTDIESIDRFAGSDFVQNSAFVNSIFTQREQEYCFSHKTAAPHLTARYCGKEAIVKALVSIGAEGVRYTDIEIVNEPDGLPVARIVKEGFRDLEIHLSLSHCRDKAVAFAIITDGEC